jgi:hypothetical protein
MNSSHRYRRSDLTTSQIIIRLCCVVRRLGECCDCAGELLAWPKCILVQAGARAQLCVRACVFVVHLSGFDEEPVADRGETQSMLAAKNLGAKPLRDMKAVEHWLGVLSAELLGRLEGEARNPKSLVLQWSQHGQRRAAGPAGGHSRRGALSLDCRAAGKLMDVARGCVV